MIIKKYFIRILVFAVVLLSVLIPCEFGIRLMYPKFDPSGRVKFEYNDEFGIRIGRKNYSGRQIKNTGDYDAFIRFNKYGFRDNKDVSQIKPEEFAVVGDSFSLGWGVDEDKRYSNLLQKMLGKPVYNISISNNLEGYKGLLNYAASTGANINNVILGLCMENDLTDYNKLQPERTVNASAYDKIKNYLYNFALFNLFTTYIHSSPKLRQFAVKYSLIIDNIDGITKNEVNKQVLESSINILGSLNKRYNLLIVIIPSRGLWVGSNKTVESEVHEEFAKLLAVNGINFIDLRKPFEASGKPLSYHFKNDGHWNEKGHKLAAKEIYNYLDLNCDKLGGSNCTN